MENELQQDKEPKVNECASQEDQQFLDRFNLPEDTLALELDEAS